MAKIYLKEVKIREHFQGDLSINDLIHQIMLLYSESFKEEMDEEINKYMERMIKDED